MDSAGIGRRLGLMLNSHEVFTPAEKGKATGEIVNYIRDLEQAVDAVLERQQKILDFKPGVGSGEIGEAQLALHESIDRLREVHNG